MDIIKEIAKAIIVLIRAGCVFRVIYCLVRLSAAEDDRQKYKNRMKNTIIFYIIGESIWQIESLIRGYFG